VEGLSSGDAEVRRTAIEGLQHLGSDARAAIPALIEAMGDPEGNVRKDATVALTSATLRSDDVEARRRAAWALGEMAAAAKNAMPALRQAAKDSDQTVSEGAEYSLHMIARGL
jgi:HEAT repeat protein